MCRARCEAHRFRVRLRRPGMTEPIFSVLRPLRSRIRSHAPSLPRHAGLRACRRWRQFWTAGHDVAAVYTRAPKPAGRRGLTLTPSPVHALAEARGLPVRTPKSLRDPAEQAAFAALNLEVAVVVGYGLILPAAILAAPRHGCLNLHPSLLPRWRGAAPIQRPIMAGDAETAAAIMVMEEGLDTGPVALERRVPIPPDATDRRHARRAGRAGREADGRGVGKAGGRYAGSRAPRRPKGVIYAAKIDKAEARVDWSRPAREVHDLIRGLSPSPGAWTEADLGRGPERVKLLRSTLVEGSGPPGATLDDRLSIACGGGALRILEVQVAGKKAMAADAFLAGTGVPAGMLF